MALKKSTPHISAQKGQIAKRVLMPGDPKRAEWIAKTFLKKYKLVSDVRGILAFTGAYKNVPVTVMAHGMGIPSICIYSHELYSFYGVEVIYRIGSCGVTNAAKANVGDVILASSCWSDIPIKPWTNVKTDGPHIFKPTKSCVELIKKVAKKHNIAYNEQRAISGAFFYNDASVALTRKTTKAHVYEMEGFGLFLEAKRNKKKAACLLTVSDNIQTHEEMSAEARATTFYDMAKLALEAIIKEKI